MRLLALTVVITLFASSAFAQGAPDPTNAQIHRGDLKIGAGIGLGAAGLLLYPIQTGARLDRNVGLAAGVVGTGFVLIAWGAWQRQHKASPQTTLGVTVGNRTGIQFVRRW